MNSIQYLTYSQVIWAGLITLVVNIVVTWIIAFTKQSGQNKAIQNNTAKITELQETVKSGFAVSNANKISFDTLKREAIINYYEKAHVLIFYFERAKFDYHNLKRIEEELTQPTTDLSNALSRVRLFVEDFETYQANLFHINQSLNTLVINYLMCLRGMDQYSTGGEVQLNKFRETFNKLRTEQLQILSTNVQELTPKLRTLIKAEELKK